MFLILKLLFCLFRLIKLEFNFSLTRPFLKGSLYKKYECCDTWKKKFHLFFRRKNFLKGFRKATQMKTTPWLPSWSTWWLLKKKIQISAEVNVAQQSCDLLALACLPVAVQSVAKPYWCHMCPDVSTMALFVSVQQIKTLTLPPTSLGWNSPDRSGVSTRKEESRVPIAARSACARGSAAFCVVSTFEACEVQHFLLINYRYVGYYFQLCKNSVAF